VNRLIRVGFGPFELGKLDDGAVEELTPEQIRDALGDLAKDIDLDGPVLAHEAPSRKPRRPPPERAEPPRETRPRRDQKKQRRRDRTGGPRPKYPRAKE
jgi:23S rRNA pseudouridine2605 synthase